MPRLKCLRAKGFRQFSRPIEVPLDADVVLLFGANGSGKTTLLSAIEFAITGHVSDLAGFGDDYPACLINQPHPRVAESMLVMETPSGDAEYRAQLKASGASSLHYTGPDEYVDAGDAYIQRSLLSQARQRRLLEVTDWDGKGRAPLSRILEKMLGLHSLDSLSEGLRPANNIVTLGNRVDALGRAQVRRSTRAEMLRGVEGRIAALVERELQLEHQPKPSAEEGGSSDIQDRLAAATDALSDERVQSEREATRRSEYLTLVQRAAVLDQSVATVDRLKREYSAAATENQRSLTALEHEVADAGLESSPWTTLVGWARADLMRDVVAGAVHAAAMDVDAHRQLRSDLRDAKRREEALASAWSSVQAAPDAISRRGLEETVVVLESALKVIESDDCPVCGRDYRETREGSLRRRVERQLQRLKDDMGRLDQQSRSPGEMLRNLEAARERLRDCQLRFDESACRLPIVEARVDALRPLLGRLERVCADAVGVRSLASRLAEAEQSLESAQLAAQRASEIAAAVNESMAADAVSNSEGVQEALDRRVRRSLDAVERASDRVRCLQEALQVAIERETIRAELSKAREELRQLREEAARADREVEAAKKVQADAKLVLDTVERIKKDAMQAAISQGLNVLWEDIYRRLVRGEPFGPRVDDPRIVRRRLQLEMRAVLQSTDCAMHPESVLSSGNLNTYALSLFVALNIMDKSGLPITVMDDPVQSMDEIHVSNFASLVRTVSRDVGRQVIIAVHERDLFDYLLLELQPVSSGQSLLSLELAQSTGGSQVVVSRY